MTSVEQYTNREIDMKFDAVHERFDDQDEALQKILDQTTRTNGKVMALEKWRWLITGGVIAVGAMGIPGLSVILKAFSGI